jgi:hypothetical protein
VSIVPVCGLWSRLPAQLYLGLTQFTPRRAICVQDSSDVSFSASMFHRRFSTACRVYAYASDHHSTSFCGTCMKIRFAEPSLLRGPGYEAPSSGRESWCLPYSNSPFARATCRGVRRGDYRNSPLRPSYVPGVRGRGGNNTDVTETRRQYLQAAGGPGMWWDSQPDLCS